MPDPQSPMASRHRFMWPALAFTAALAGCAGTKPAVTGGAPVQNCAAVARNFHHPATRIVSAEAVAAGTLRLAGITEPMPAHCVVKGVMHERVSAVDGKPYAIGFEMRLPTAWNGRFFYQANGGLDGVIAPAYGDILGGGPRSNALLQGFAVISSDAGTRWTAAAPSAAACSGSIRRRGAITATTPWRSSRRWPRR